MKLFHICLLIVTFSCLSRVQAMNQPGADVDPVREAQLKKASADQNGAADDQMDADGVTRGRFFGKKKPAADATAAAATAQGAVSQVEQELKNMGTKAVDFEARLQKLEGSARCLKPALVAGGALGVVALVWVVYQLLYHTHSDDVAGDDYDYEDDEESQTDDVRQEPALAHA